MSLHVTGIGPIPEETVRVARAAFPKGNVYMHLRDVLGTIYEDARFAPLFGRRGRPGEAPWRLALITVMQFAEGLSDRQVAEAVRARIDWKYALGLELTDAGFDFSVLSAFRTRLVRGGAEQQLLEALLEACRARGYIRARGRQRTDSTRVWGPLRVLNRLGRVSETLRQALNAVALVAPDWLRRLAPPEWYERYGRRIENDRLPRGQAARQAYAGAVGADGQYLLNALEREDAPAELQELEAVELLRRVWRTEFELRPGHMRLREPKPMPPMGELIESPYEPEARYCTKRDLHWTGHRVHPTESCEATLPHLITHVETTVASVQDVEQLPASPAGLAEQQLLPAEHIVDAGYVSGRTLATSRVEYQVDLVGPIVGDHRWQAQAGQGFDAAHFQVDWDARVVTCPQGHRSARWCVMHTARQRPMIHVAFAPEECTPCPARSLCTRAKSLPRHLTLQVQAEYDAIQAARQRQTTPEFAARYACRAGIEGTLSQGVRAFGLRRARYRGLRKTHLQHLATAAAMNVRRLDAWLHGVPIAATRCSHFASLAT